MRFHLSCALLALAACQTVSEPAPAPEPAPAAPVPAAPAAVKAVHVAPARRIDSGPVLPPAKSGFTLKATDRGGPSLEQLLDEMAKATGVHFQVGPATRGVLRQMDCGITSDMDVPADSAWTLCELLLLQNDVLLMPVHRSDPFLIVAVAKGQDGEPLRVKSNAAVVDVEDLERYAKHPGLLVMTIIDVDPIDARQLSTTLRQLFPDQYTQSILPLGVGNQLLLQGFGPSVLAMARQLQDAAARERQRLSEVAPPEPEPASAPPK